MNLCDFINTTRPELEDKLKELVLNSLTKDLPELNDMLCHHFGWEKGVISPGIQGKRMRPMLVFLCTETAGGCWRDVMLPATAVEILHNFSLIHDDIQDNSPTRRGKPAIWAKWGVPQAINAGDFLFALANKVIIDTNHKTSSQIALKNAQLLNETCLSLTRGQYLDISFETSNQISIESYFEMIKGKTAALIACCAELGAIAAGTLIDQQKLFHRFGNSLGLAFQVWDDWLGIWGNYEHTGKSVESDLVAGKKVLPVIYALEKKGDFARRWSKGPISHGEVPEIAEMLVKEGAQKYTEKRALNLLDEALLILDQLVVNQDAGRVLKELARSFVNREN